MGVLARVAVLAAGALAIGCDADLAPIPSWVPADEIEGKSRPEIVQPASPEIAGDRLRVVTYNVLAGIEVEALAAHVLTNPDLKSADLLLIQETQGHDGTHSDAARLATALGMGYVYAPTNESDHGTGGLAILSRFTLTAIEVILLPEEADVDTVGPAARAGLAVVIDTPGGPVRFVNVHLDAALNITERILQLRPAILDAPSPIVVAGDFNTNDYIWAGATIPIFPLDMVADTSQAPALDDYLRELGFDTPTAAFGPTWSGLPEDQRLDAIFTRGLGSGDGAVDRELDLSDHWPVWLDVEVRH